MAEGDRKRRERSSRGGVFRLNGGASTFGRGSTLPMNAPGGSFMSGRPAGGGIGAGADVITRALAGSQSPFSAPQGQSVEGSPEVGPPPATPSPVTPDFRPDTPDIPSFTPPPTTSVAPQLRAALFPSFQPIVQPPLDPRRPRFF